MAVAGIAGIGHEDFVARVDGRQAGQLQRGRGAGRDHDAPRRHIHAEALRIPVADALAQLGQAQGRRVLRGAALHGTGRSLLHQRGAVKSGSPMFRKIIGVSLSAQPRAISCAALAISIT